MTTAATPRASHRRPRYLAWIAVVAAVMLTASLAPLWSSSALFTAVVGYSNIITPQTAYQKAVLADSPVAYWPMNESAAPGAITDVVGSRVGVNENVSPWLRTHTLNSKYSQQVGSGGQFRTPAISGLNQTAGTKITVEFWMQVAVGSDQVMPFALSSTQDLWINGGSFGFNSGNGDLLGGPNADLLGRPVHVVAVFPNDAAGATTTDYINGRKMYWDGVQVPLTMFGTPTPRGSVGNSAAMSGWLDGSTNYRLPAGSSISDLAFYNGELSAARIAAHYQAANAYAANVVWANPAAYWRMDEPSGTALTDFMGKVAPATYPSGVALAQTGLVRGPRTSVNWNGAGYAESSITLPVNAATYTTVEFWMDVPSFPARRMPVTVGDFSIWMSDEGGTQQFGVNASYNNLRGVPWSSVGNGRHHVVIYLYSGDQAASRMWIDGTERTLTTYGTMNPNPQVNAAQGQNQVGNIRIGGSMYQPPSGPLDDYRWPYRLDEVAIYPFGLNPDLIRAHYLLGR